MSDLFPVDPGQENAVLSPDLAQLDELLLVEGQRWRRAAPSTARLERHVQALVRQSDALSRHEEEHMLTERNQTPTAPSLPTLQRRAPSRWRGALPAVATLLLVALAATIFALFGTQRPQTGANTNKHSATAAATVTATAIPVRVAAMQPAQTHLPIPANAYLSSLSFSSAHDGWAVGGIRIPDTSGQDFSSQHGLLVHYHDGVWTAASDAFPGETIDSVSMVSADDGWAIGSTINPPDNSGGKAVLLHYTGGHWRPVNIPALANTHPISIRMLSSDFGYITAVVNVPAPGTNGSVDQLLSVLVYQQGMWKTISTPFTAFMSAVVMVSPVEGWAASNESGQGILYHYLNGVWSKSETLGGGVDLISIASGNAANDVWMTARQCGAPGLCGLLLFHFDGVTWKSVELLKTGTTWSNAIHLSVFAGGSSGVWLTVVTQDDTKPPSQRSYQTTMWLYTNGAWTRVNQPVAGGGAFALASDGDGGTWALVQTDTPFAMSVLYTQGGAWKVYGQN